MENTLYVALSRQQVLRRNMEVIANNIANAATPAFQGEQLMFVEHLVEAGKKAELSFVQDIGVARDTSHGDLNRTGNPLDLAIRGSGWFVVRTPQGERYTRNGSFHLDQDGALVTSGGFPVLDRSGQEIVLDPGDDRIDIAADGWIETNSGSWQIGVVSFDNDQLLRKVSDGLYQTALTPKDAEGAEIVQGMIEGSNVEPIIEVTRMIQTLRDYQSAGRIIDAEHERQRRAIQTITNTN